MISVFTITNNPKWLEACYQSLLNQTYQDWEWVVLLNGGARYYPSDIKVRVRYASTESTNIGALKREACAHCKGDIMLELDHDDQLMRTALEEVDKAFAEDDSVGFVYSNAVRYTDDFKPVQRFSDRFGWKYRMFKHENGAILDECITPDPAPESVSRIWFAPDHLRAWRSSIYREVGSHRADLSVLDDQNLMCRMYLKTAFKHIDKPLYLYQVHGDNTWIKRNKEIQDSVLPMYDRFIEPMALAWAKRQRLQAIDLGGRFNKPDGYLSVDLVDADINTNLNVWWPFPDNSVGVVRAFDIFEHLTNPIVTMQELSRVLVPGGFAFIQVPSTDGRGAFQDPTHVSYWNENSFLYYTDRRWAQYIDTPVRFQATRLYTTPKDVGGVCWTKAHLVNCKNYTPCGEVLI